MSGIRMARSGRTTTVDTTAEFDVVALRAKLRGHANDAAERSRDLIGELRSLVGRLNSLHLVGQVATWMTMGDARSDEVDLRFGLEAQAEFLIAVAVESGQPTGELAGPAEVQEALSILSDLFEAEGHRLMGEMVDGDGGPLDEVLFVVRHEALLDRTQGYVQHLATVTRAVFEPIRDTCVEALGFSPADIPALVDAYRLLRQRRFDDRLETASVMPVDTSLPAATQAAIRMSWVVFILNDPAGDVDAAELAGEVGLPVEQVIATLDALATPWAQPVSELRPGNVLGVRRRSVLLGSDGNYGWPLPWSALHEILPWFTELASTNSVVASAFQRDRASASENLVCEALSEVFGADRVYSNVEYPIGSGNWAECDVVVRLPGHAFAVEVKSGALDSLFLTGDSEYASSTFRTLVDDPFRQSERAARALLAGTRWRSKGGKVKQDWPAVSGVTRIAISLERIDAMSLAASRLSPAVGTADATWVVCVADFLMVAEILNDPHTLFAYARVRADLAANPRVAVMSEADLLGAFLHDRLRLLRRSAGSTTGRSIASLSHHATALNEYYTALAAGLTPNRRPSLRLRNNDRARLDRLWTADDPRWAEVTAKAILR